MQNIGIEIQVSLWDYATSMFKDSLVTLLDFDNFKGNASTVKASF